MKIGTNITSLRAQRELSKSTTALASAFGRLASGMRINGASDDAAGLAMADQLRSHSRLYAQGIRNANDATSMLNLAEEGVQALVSIVTRITELSEQAANEVYSSAQRQSLDSEAQALRSEFNRIVATTTFNGKKLLDGSSGSTSVQVGVDSSVNSQINLEEIAISQHSANSQVVGTGEFTGPTNLAVTGVTTKPSTGDLNNDGFDDIVQSGDRLTILLSNGDGTFSKIDPGLSGAQGLTNLADLDGDGNLDFVVSNGVVGNAAFLGNGDGTFAISAIAGFSNPERSDLIDLNNDGNADLVTSYGYGTGDKFTIRLGNGTGTFGAVSTYNTAATLDIVMAAGVDLSAAAGLDFNNDGFVDLASSHNFGTNTYIRLNNGDGQFAAPIVVDTIGTMVDVGDVNNDGTDEFLFKVGSDLYQRLGNGDGTFTNRTLLLSNVKSENDLYDLNGDGALDILSFDTTGVQVYFNNGDGTFGAASTASAPATVYRSAAGDFNNDGVPDFAIATYTLNSVAVYFSETTTTGGSENTTGTGGLPYVDLTTVAAARTTLESAQNTLEELNVHLAKIGAGQSRLSSAINYNSGAQENTLAAESRIRNADIASEMSQLLRQQILQQAATAVLAQANQNPAIVLQLLS